MGINVESVDGKLKPAIS